MSSTQAPSLAELLALPPGWELMRGLLSLDPARLDGDEHVAVLRAWERLRAFQEAAQLPWVNAVAGPAGGADWGREEVAAALRLSMQGAQRRIDTARALTRRLSATADALRAGTISYWHALRLVEAVQPLTALQQLEVEARVLPGAAEQTAAEFGRALKRAVIAVAPQDADRRHDTAMGLRSLARYDLPDGMGGLVAETRADGITTIFTAADTYARRVGVDTSVPIAARRVDALVDICAAWLNGASTGACETTGKRARRRARRETNVTVPLPTLLGLAQDPGHLPGYGPIPPEMARRLAEGTEWRRFTTDPQTGQLLDRSPDTYTPSVALGDYVDARDQVCTFPGCQQPAHLSERDHLLRFSRGGKTTRANLGDPCPRHHKLKHQAGWTVTRTPDGQGYTWTSPKGQTYTTYPPRRE